MSTVFKNGEPHPQPRPKTTLENVLSLMEEIERLKNERLKLHARLGYCYSQMNNKLAQPVMSYEEWLGQIDKVIAK